jgi:ankyrin repeat and BTB/POZ domain-containing protein 1
LPLVASDQFAVQSLAFVCILLIDCAFKMVLKKHEIEAALHAEKQEISAGRLKEDNPLDDSREFEILCQACRRGDLKVCQEMIMEGININARDRFDYTPLILVSLCVVITP